ncbi:MAG: hypothetical protein CVV64_04095 [Candidatus Wallbacteria bacterium HGW-Wallbacteria-1]|jgi:hypothetical protein|uniref:HD domain-containing protein n=1 Tax=Candidatus Wallbacteria bacterium HGW-Wallbacteria-1 TaxID=2013854 RepID=A0A2N1PRK0_9BACT|nr:MAG: hypothetical protein CVV64_04095 [Candidatus Wallbacteria bacterium HGW-Wallbacteria-1]
MDSSAKLQNILEQNIQDTRLLEFLNFCLRQHAEKFFTLPVSISFHGRDAGREGSNAQHIIRCLEIAIALKPILTAEACNVNFDHLLGAITLHDMGKLMCYAKENGIWKYFGVNSSAHPGIGAELVEKLAYQFSIQIPEILGAIKAHYGPYGNVNPETPLEWGLHLIEMLETKCKAD